jgi:hypothetical protein
MTEAGALLIKTIIGSLSDDELLELAKPIDDVDLDKLPTIKKVLGLDKNERDY